MNSLYNKLQNSIRKYSDFSRLFICILIEQLCLIPLHISSNFTSDTIYHLPPFIIYCDIELPQRAVY